MTSLQHRIQELVERHGSVRAAARVVEIDPAYLYRLSTGEKDEPSDNVLRKLKLRRTVTVSYFPLRAVQSNDRSES